MTTLYFVHHGLKTSVAVSQTQRPAAKEWWSDLGSAYRNPFDAKCSNPTLYGSVETHSMQSPAERSAWVRAVCEICVTRTYHHDVTAAFKFGYPGPG